MHSCLGITGCGHLVRTEAGLLSLPAWPTLARPFTRLTQKVSSSLLSSSARTQCLGGCRYRPHSCTVQEACCISRHNEGRLQVRMFERGLQAQAECTAGCCGCCGSLRSCCTSKG